MSYSSESLSPPRPVALGRLRLRHPGRTTLLPTVTLGWDNSWVSDPSSPLLPALPELHGGYKGVASSGLASLAGRPCTFSDFRPQEFFKWFGIVCEHCRAGDFSCRSKWLVSVPTCRSRAGLGHVLPWDRHYLGHDQQLLVPAQAPEHCRLWPLLAARA